MRVLALYGNPKRGGFVHGCIDCAADRVAQAGISVEKVALMEKEISECTGCFTCLRTGLCVIEDDMNGLCTALREADGLIVGASVRNSYAPALFKRFYERITYPVGFTRDLADTPVLAIGAVGLASGKRALRGLLSFTEFEANLIAYLFFRTGIPTRLTVEAVAPKVTAAADRFIAALRARPKRSILARIKSSIDNFVIRKSMLEKDKDGTYANVIRVWKEKGRM